MTETRDLCKVLLVTGNDGTPRELERLVEGEGWALWSVPPGGVLSACDAWAPDAVLVAARGDEALRVVGNLLDNEPALSVVVVGHQDDDGAALLERGAFEHISSSRAEHRVLHAIRRAATFTKLAGRNRAIASQMEEVREVAGKAHDLDKQNKQLESALSALRSIQVKLVAAEKMASLGQLLADVAHELRNPTNMVYANGQFLGEHTSKLLTMLDATLVALEGHPARAGIDRQAEDLDLAFVREDMPQVVAGILEGADRIKKLVEKLRGLGRSSEGRRTEYRLQEGVEKTMTMLGRSGRRNVDIVTELGEAPPVLVDPDSINQVILNLITNAIQAVEGRETRRVVIRVAGEDDAVRLSVSDSGPGVPEELRHRIFDPFFTTKGENEGTGLGLTISYNLVDSFGGAIEVDRGPEGGARFTVTLPRAGAKGRPSFLLPSFEDD